MSASFFRWFGTVGIVFKFKGFDAASDASFASVGAVALPRIKVDQAHDRTSGYWLHPFSNLSDGRAGDSGLT